jgi:protein RecA
MPKRTRTGPTKKEPLSEQMESKVKKTTVKKKKTLDGNTEKMVSTGSTLLDLAISGGRVRGGGIPGGILVEIFGPSGSGKTVLLCEIAGGVARQGGEIMFKDPEARLDKEFASIFGLNVSTIDYDQPNLVSEVFKPVRTWKPVKKGLIHGVFADSLAALSTDWEMEDKDQYGMRRAKQFSEELRKTCRVIAQENLLMVCSNQVRQNLDAGPYGQKFTSPGGLAIGFYASLRLRMIGSSKIKKETSVKGKKHSRYVGITTEIEVHKSSVWKPYRRAPITILFNYGIDDIRENLKFVKQFSGEKVYTVNDTRLDNSIENAISIVEDSGLEQQLKEQVMDLWEDLESKFEEDRKPKKR